MYHGTISCVCSINTSGTKTFKTDFWCTPIVIVKPIFPPCALTLVVTLHTYFLLFEYIQSKLPYFMGPPAARLGNFIYVSSKFMLVILFYCINLQIKYTASMVDHPSIKPN